MTTEKQPRLVWRREPPAKGLAAITQGVRGWQLRYGDRVIIRVEPSVTNYTVRGWYWYGGDEALSIPRQNSFPETVATADEAKAQATEHVKAHLKRPEEDGPK